jgi:hypothetical protein
LIAAETEAGFKVGASLRQATARLAGIVGTMECAAAMVAADSARLRRQLNINLLEKLEKVWILQEGVVHFDGLLAS